jgi:phage protein D/phage baseplate assembly protein gpV
VPDTSSETRAGQRPDFELRIGGSAVEPRLAHDVVEIDVSDEVNRHGRCSLLIQNWDADRREVRWSDSATLAPGSELEVLLGYGNDLSTVFSGVVTALTAHFPQDQAPTLQVEARSRSILLAGPGVSRMAEDSTDGDLISSLASDAGLDVDTEDGAQHEGIVVERRSPWPYLVERATALGWVVYVRDTTLVARPPRGPEDPLELTWTRDVTELRLTQDLARLPSGSSAASWDPANQEQQQASADSPSGGLPHDGRDDHAAAVQATRWPGREEMVASAAPLPQLEARARARALQAELRHVTGLARTVGLAKLRCDSWVRITGTGTRFSGPHYVGSVRHRLGGAGFTTELGLGLAEPLAPPSTRQADGSRPWAGRLVTGVVTDIKDPEGHARVKVSFPWSGSRDATWARLLTPYAGDQQGLVLVPDVDQEVLVGFLDGNDDFPVVVGSLWSAVAPPPVSPDSQNAIRCLVTRSGHRLTFDDSDQGGVTVHTDGGHELLLSDSDGKVAITAKGGNSITLSDDGIEVSASTGDLVLSAPGGEVRIAGLNLSAKADAGASVESSGTLDIKASATLGLKGALVNIN